VNNLHIIFVIQ